MASQLSWLDSSRAEQQRMRELLNMFSEQESRDELGIGQVRDAFGDLLFSGPRTLHTRARYLLIVPWCIRQAARRPDRDQALELDRVERLVISNLRVAGASDGLIGRRASTGVKTLPSTIYASALRRYGVDSGAEPALALDEDVNGFAESASALLDLSYPDSLAPSLLAAIAAARQLAGWTSFDSGRHCDAQRHLQSAERAAVAAGDVLLAARVRYCQARQLQHLRHNRDALETLRLARDQLGTAATPAVSAMIYSAEAASRAALGDRDSALNALGRARLGGAGGQGRRHLLRHRAAFPGRVGIRSRAGSRHPLPRAEPVRVPSNRSQASAQSLLPVPPSLRRHHCPGWTEATSMEMPCWPLGSIAPHRPAMLPGMATARAKRWMVAAMTVSIVVVAVLVWWLWPERKPPNEPLARQYRDFTVCLLTDERGVGGPEAQPMWTGIQEAALAARVRSQYLSVAGEQTGENAATFLASLAQGQCDMVFAAGAAPAEAVRTKAHMFPHIRFYLINPRTSVANVSAMDAADVHGSAYRLVVAAAAAASQPR